MTPSPSYKSSKNFYSCFSSLCWLDLWLSSTVSHNLPFLLGTSGLLQGLMLGWQDQHPVGNPTTAELQNSISTHGVCNRPEAHWLN